MDMVGALEGRMMQWEESTRGRVRRLMMTKGGFWVVEEHEKSNGLIQKQRDKAEKEGRRRV
jgi:hypothetical protein